MVVTYETFRRDELPDNSRIWDDAVDLFGNYYEFLEHDPNRNPPHQWYWARLQKPEFLRLFASQPDSTITLAKLKKSFGPPQLIGQAITTSWDYGIHDTCDRRRRRKVRICWVSQVVVHHQFREVGIATGLLEHIMRLPDLADQEMKPIQNPKKGRSSEAGVTAETSKPGQGEGDDGEGGSDHQPQREDQATSSAATATTVTTTTRNATTTTTTDNTTTPPPPSPPSPSQRRFPPVDIYGTMSAHPAIILALARAFAQHNQLDEAVQPLDHVNFQLIRAHLRDIMAGSPLPQVRAAEPRGVLFQRFINLDDDESLDCGARTDFFAPPSATSGLVKRARDRGWSMGRLPPRSEFVVLVPRDVRLYGEFTYPGTLGGWLRSLAPWRRWWKGREKKNKDKERKRGGRGGGGGDQADGGGRAGQERRRRVMRGFARR